MPTEIVKFDREIFIEHMPALLAMLGATHPADVARAWCSDRVGQAAGMVRKEAGYVMSGDDRIVALLAFDDRGTAGKRLVGYASAMFNKARTLAFPHVLVATNARRSGHGKELMAELLAELEASSFIGRLLFRQHGADNGSIAALLTSCGLECELSGDGTTTWTTFIRMGAPSANLSNAVADTLERYSPGGDLYRAAERRQEAAAEREALFEAGT